MAATLGIVIPTLNAAATLPATLAVLADHDLVAETVVVDGGSTDATLDVAKTGGARVIAASAGRGQQLAAGAEAVAGDWLWFLHADAMPDLDWPEAVAAFMRDPANAARAGYARFALDDAAPAARRLEAIVRWRSRVLGLPYGDQGLLLARSFYRALGGFQPLPLMEDVDLVRRIGKRRLVALPLALRSSAARYRRAGYLARPARNLTCLALYFLGVPPRLLVRLYG
jgi:rSAM/selenodomain-associated transferase 2